ncbi:hypothetical protein ANN_27625 [Periplaneta americana]|uniref:Uncharacterized protein n=1 Tax=Periplaneta americana TaxID=6978 RepID=A0ABQ8RW87_PERAM|nr:hypothetical protein ANN_27625 [Periplaneta americana]
MCAWVRRLTPFYLVAMEVVKMEFETDPLAVQSNEYTEIKEQKPLLEKGTSSNSQLIWMKKEYEDPSSNLNSEVKIEEMSVTITFPLKCESEAESCDLDTVKEEETLEVTTEKDEFLPESTMNVGDSKTSLLKSTTPENFTSIENSTCDSSSEPESYDELLGNAQEASFSLNLPVTITILPYEWNSSNPQQVCMKAEHEDHSSYHTSEVKTEQMLMPVPFPLKCESQEDSYDVDRVKEEQSLEVKTEEDEFLSERCPL